MSTTFVSNGHSNAPTLVFSAEASMMLYLLIRMSAERGSAYAENPAFGKETGGLFVAWLDKNTNEAIVPCIPLCKQIVSGAATTTPAGEHEKAWGKCIEFVSTRPEWQYLLDETKYEPVNSIFHHHVHMSAFASGAFSRKMEDYYTQNPSTDTPSFLHFSDYGKRKHFSLIMNIPTLQNFNIEELYNDESELRDHYYDVVKDFRGNRISNNFCFLYNQPKIQSFNQDVYYLAENAQVDEETGVTYLGKNEPLTAEEVKKAIAEGFGNQLIVARVEQQIYTDFQTTCTTIVQSSDTGFPPVLLEYADKTTLKTMYYQLINTPPRSSMSTEELIQFLMQTIQTLCIDGGNGGKKPINQPMLIVGQDNAIRNGIFLS